ncbi:putative zinc alcohol dehydrogenase [Aspergillus nomiae NRRL 13137]|uniref:Putative zinc alcohol dehydrogenase n=1 Tax=Aspergillus nomiae NRRL (strain ATCC 15546 / NRRL 13137 / CBS 260.88 / M93) TaxID=1509407 RepID=A0A0L1J8R2_ASPN3|nr:putative zinc alcohol dehydrogenase [Aspergillus nomiae NRRL 13137]KNG88070.1 putative zinc alcohol dehydrogenase [Aspergillus nomiae NRRL 13137]
MKAWLYNSTKGGLEKNLIFSPDARNPGSPQGDQLLIQVISTAINPADYKAPAMSTVCGKVLIATTPASPGMDFCGRVITMGTDTSARQFTPGQLVFGCLGMPRQFGTLGELILASATSIAPLPVGVDPDAAATIGVAGRSSYQSIVPYISTPGNRVFINGGSGGCGVYGIQIAKFLGCHVTVTCSTRNVQFCRDLGADEVIDYTTQDVLKELKSQGQVFDHVVDHIGLPEGLYEECHKFLKPGKVFVQVGASSMLTFAHRLIRPAFLGGGKRKYVALLMKNHKDELVQIADWIQEGKIRVELDTVCEFEDTVKAFERLRSGRTRGKIVIHVTSLDSEAA